MVIRKVEAPPPSRWPIMAMMQVITATPTTLVPTFFIRALMIRSNRPTSFMMPKNSTEKMNRAAVEWTSATPAEIKSPISEMEKVPVSTRMAVVTVDTPTKARAGTVTFRSSRMMMAMTVAKPSSANKVSFIVTSSSFFFLPSLGFGNFYYREENLHHPCNPLTVL